MTATELPQTTIATKLLRLVVVGNGMAGARAVEEVMSRNGGELFDITVFGDEPYGNYNRIMLSGLLSGEHEERDIILNDVDWYTERGIRLHTGTRIARIDRESRQVYSQDGARFPYDVLVIATGSRPFMPSVDGLRRADGALRDGVFGFRTVEDTRDMMRTAREHRRAAVIGGGLLGLEAARGLMAHGLRVDLLHAAEWLMNQQLDEIAGSLLRRQIEELGISVHCSARTEEILGASRVEGVRLADGTVIACDMVVVAAGIRSNNELATGCGLTVDRAIVVDDQLRTVDDENIYAVGECAQHRGQVYGLVAPLWEQARVLAAHLTGARSGTTYAGSRTATKLKVAGVDVATMGVKAPELESDEHVVFSEPRRGVLKSVVIRDDRLIGATLVGDVGRAASLIQAFDRGLPLPADRARLLFDLRTASAEPNAEDLDDEAQVCNCNGVSKGTLVRTVQDGARSAAAVMDRTRAGKGCGSCKGLVNQIVDGAVASSPRSCSEAYIKDIGVLLLIGRLLRHYPSDQP
ncbi:MAG TPA: FAD-dependent oxidoreductase [Mycobacteriales bacterium]|jgi:nitrite reductase (NADH) large subunit|nr:FAD-dependent oxidoreductase [Mycobacteriales bacterium]